MAATQALTRFEARKASRVASKDPKREDSVPPADAATARSSRAVQPPARVQHLGPLDTFELRIDTPGCDS